MPLRTGNAGNLTRPLTMPPPSCFATGQTPTSAAAVPANYRLSNRPSAVSSSGKSPLPEDLVARQPSMPLLKQPPRQVDAQTKTLTLTDTQPTARQRTIRILLAGLLGVFVATSLTLS